MREPSDPSPPGDGHPVGRAKPCKPPPGLPELRSRLAEAEETLRAIRSGEVDALVTVGKNGPQVFTLEGADHAYRVLIESMNEGALTLTPRMAILYANQCFARMVGCPLEQVTGSSFYRFLSTADRTALRQLVKLAAEGGSKIQVRMHVGDGSALPVQISLRPLARKGRNRASIGMVVTDMTEARETEELLRTLTHRVMQAQEAERRGVAHELHDHITQLLCATLIRSQTLANQLSAREDGLKQEAIKLQEMLGETAEEVERISRDMRPSVLEELGLSFVLCATTKEFAKRTGVPVKVSCVALPTRLPAETELTLYRILQEALANVEQHASARHVSVRLTKQAGVLQLVIHDDGIGFDPENHPAIQEGKFALGLVCMRERAAYSGGSLRVKSVRSHERSKTGTTIEVRIPLVV